MRWRWVVSEQAVSPVIGTMLLVALGVILAVSLMGIASITHPIEAAPHAVIVIDKAEITDSGLQRITLLHRGGEEVDVSDIKIITEVNGIPLKHQLNKLPAKAGVTGYRGALGGVLHARKSGNYWRAGDTGWFNIAKSNLKLKKGDVVRVSIVHKPSGLSISTSEKHVR